MGWRGGGGSGSSAGRVERLYAVPLSGQPDKLDSIFDLFSQVDQSLEKAEGGLGIGLTLAKQLVELQHGHIRARSAGPGAGSEFIVELPLVDAPGRRPSPTPDAEAPPVSRRILVVDDNQDSADTLAMLLEMSKHETIVVYDGEAAIAAASAHRPDVILLDIGLPGLNGYDVCRLIRQESWSSDTLIIALTGWGKEEDRRQSEVAGFDAHLVKPVDHTTLLSLLASHVVRSA